MPSYLQRNNHKHVLFCLYYVMYIIPLLVFNVFLESRSASAVHGRRMREEKFIGVILTPPPTSTPPPRFLRFVYTCDKNSSARPLSRASCILGLKRFDYDENEIRRLFIIRNSFNQFFFLSVSFLINRLCFLLYSRAFVGGIDVHTAGKAVCTGRILRETAVNLDLYSVVLKIG